MHYRKIYLVPVRRWVWRVQARGWRPLELASICCRQVGKEKSRAITEGDMSDLVTVADGRERKESCANPMIWLGQWSECGALAEIRTREEQ